MELAARPAQAEAKPELKPGAFNREQGPRQKTGRSVVDSQNAQKQKRCSYHYSSIQGLQENDAGNHSRQGHSSYPSQ